MTYPRSSVHTTASSRVVRGTNPGRIGRKSTSLVRALGPGLLALALVAASPAGRAGPAGVVDRADLERTQAAGWLELQRDQARYRQQIERSDLPPSLEVRQALGILERQEDLDRRALDQREALWLYGAQHHDRLVGQGALTVPQWPTLRLLVDQAEASERLSRDLRRQILTPSPPMAPILAPQPFRLR